MKDLDKKLAAAKKQTPSEFPFSDEELSGILSKANKTNITDYSKSKTISKGVKAMTISGITFSLVLGICMLFSSNSNTDKMGDEQYSTVAKATNIEKAEANAHAQMQINSETSIKTKGAANQTIALAGSQKPNEGNAIVAEEDKIKEDINKRKNEYKINLDSNVYEIKGNDLHIYIHNKEAVNAQTKALMLNSEEMQKLNIFQTECGISILNTGEHDLSKKQNSFDNDSILNAGYPVEGTHYRFQHFIEHLPRQYDLVKASPQMTDKKLGFVPCRYGVIYRDVEKGECKMYAGAPFTGVLHFKNREEEPYVFGGVPPRWLAISEAIDKNSEVFASLKNIIFHFDSTDNHANLFAKYRVPVFIKAKVNSKEEQYLLMFYDRTSNLRKALPARYANLETHDDMYDNYEASNDLEELNSHIKSELANAENICNKEQIKDYDDTDREVLEPFGGMRYLDLTISELESLGVYVSPNESYIYYTENYKTRFLTTKKKENLAQYGYDTTKLEIKALYSYKVAGFNEKFSSKKEIIDNALEAMEPISSTHFSICDFDIRLFFADIDSARLDKEIGGFTYILDTMPAQKKSTELKEYIKKHKYDIDVNSYLFKYLESEYSSSSYDFENNGYGLQNASELGKYVISSENNLLITLRRDKNVSTKRLTTPHSNIFWTKEDVKEKYDGLSFYVSIGDSSESLVTNRKNIAPVRYNVSRVLASGDTLQISTIAYFYITHDFVSKLPERFRADLYKELDIMGRITRGELLEDQICHEIEKKDSYFGLCASDMDLFKEFEGWVSDRAGENTLSVKFVLNEPTVMSIKTYNLQGKLINEVPEKEYDTYGREIDYHSPNIVSGVYVMHFNARDGRKYVKKFVVK